MAGARRKLFQILELRPPVALAKRVDMVDEARIDLIASDVVEHLELCGIRCIKQGPAPLYGTLAPRPMSRQDGGADGGDAGNG